MDYRKFKGTLDISTFGLGCMRLPQIEGSDGKKHVDMAEGIRIVRHAIDSGVNYVDTAYPYLDGESEILVGKALKDGYREKVNLATKLPTWLVKTPENMQELFDRQLEKLKTDHIDFYLLHALDSDRWPQLKEFGVREFLDRLKAEGKIKYACFSFHDELPIFKQIIDDYDWDMCQIQLNILDVKHQAGVEGMKYAYAKGIPTVIMEPLRGGRLVGDIPADATKIWSTSGAERTPAEWAFRWLYNFPEVLTVLSGVSTMDQLVDNIRIFQSAPSNCLSASEKKLIDDVVAVYQSLIKVGCTGCEYCLPCPTGVEIKQIFALHNDASIYNAWDKSKKGYAQLVEKGGDASKCVECGRCEGLCPQALSIIEELKNAAAALE